MAEQERAQAVGSHVEIMEQLFRLQADRLDGVQQTFNNELEVPLPGLYTLFRPLRKFRGEISGLVSCLAVLVCVFEIGDLFIH